MAEKASLATPLVVRLHLRETPASFWPSAELVELMDRGIMWQARPATVATSPLEK